MKVKVFPSFSGLLVLLNRGFVWEDSADCLYFFCCTKLGIHETFDLYDSKNILNRASILEKLSSAESEDRVLWRKEKNCTVGAAARMEWLIQKLKEKGVPVKEDKSYNSGYHDAGWNLPALSRWAEVNIPSVDIVDCEYGREWRVPLI